MPSIDDIKLSKVDTQFINMINDRITVYGMIPYTVPSKLVVMVIQQSARTFYRQGYYRASENRLMLLPKSEILKYTPKTGNTIKDVARIVPMPKNIAVIKGIYETNNSINSVLSDEELEKNILFDSTSYGQNIYGINNNMFMFDMAAKMIQYQAVRAVFSRSVMFHYNQSTYELVFYEGDFRCSFIMDCICKVNIEVLYDDDLFIRHVIASTKAELKRVIGGHSATLPGEVTINAEEICSGTDDIQVVEDILKAGNSVGDIILQR
jgi:hypothetical protein